MDFGRTGHPGRNFNWLADAVNGTDQAESKPRQTAIKTKSAEIERLAHKLSTLYEDRLDGRINVAFFGQKAAIIESQQSYLRWRSVISRTRRCRH